MTLSELPRITFGIILLNGQPFIRYNLRALYPFAHQIIVVEGAAPAASAIASADGHSTDGSLAELYRFQAEEDPQNKLEIVTRDSFWSEKDEMSKAYAERATGDYLWQVDIDEFYQPQDMQQILSMLREDPQISAVSLQQITFWGGFETITDGWYLKQGAEIFHRLFKWEPGYSYMTHRPPTVHDQLGRDLRQVKWINGYELASQNIYLYHYSLLFPQQVIEKCSYYGSAAWTQRPQAQQWAEESFMELRHPYRVHNIYHYPSWLEHFTGKHPPQIEAMRQDIQTGTIDVELRPTADVERLLKQKRYKMGRLGLKALYPFAHQAILARRRWRRRSGGGQS